MFRRIIARAGYKFYKHDLDLYKFENAVLNNLRTNVKYHNQAIVNKVSSENVNEKEFLIKMKNDPDSFGTQIPEGEEYKDDLLDEKSLEEKPLASQRLSTKQYADIIKSLRSKRKVKEAIDVLEVRMLKEDKVQPENYIYNLVIGACGRVGYTKKAFSLFNNMKKRGLTVTPGTYTALFNACANSPWPTTDGLTRATDLRHLMIEKMYEPNLTNYNAMIKAFGHGGDLSTAFGLVDEMLAKKFLIKDDTLNFLLQACISDKEAGFRHALLVWRKFIEKKIKPSLFTFNLMLRCIRDCGLGDLEITKDVIDELISKEVTVLPDTSQKLIDNLNECNTLPQNIQEDNCLNKPNLMAQVPHLGNVISLSDVVKPDERLLLVGGQSGFLQTMKDHSCNPDVKTFTLLMDNIPNTVAAENSLLQNLKGLAFKPDIDFYNMLIKRRSMRFDYKGAKEVLELFKAAGYRPNLITYGILALGCKTREEAEAFLTDTAIASYRINIEILGAMLTQACYHRNFRYVIYLMEFCVHENIQVSKKFMEKLEEFRRTCRRISNNDKDPLSKSEDFLNTFKKFRAKYKIWKEQIQLEEEVHPWQQYRQTSDTDVRHYKDKEEEFRFKPVRTSFFKQKTSNKIRK